jgi:anthranilate phosphoribosyltransferase
MIKEATAKLIDKNNLTYEEANACIDEIMSGNASAVQTAAFLVALETKGETIEEITACASAMRTHSLKLNHNMDLFEIVGTGGDGQKPLIFQPPLSIVISGGGVKVAKHGNRAASSASGAADCLEALGVNINTSPEKCLELLNTVGICFLFAQKYHTSMKYVAPIRKELGVRTIFNILGPLTNPASANMQVLGVYSEALIIPMAKVLSNLGVKRGMVVYGLDKLDEIAISCPTSVCEFKDGAFFNYVIKPEDFGLKTCDKSEIVGGTPLENAEITLSVLRGEMGAKRDTILLNAGAGLYVAGKTNSIKEGVKLSAQLIDSGKAIEKLNEFIKESNK